MSQSPAYRSPVLEQFISRIEADLQEQKPALLPLFRQCFLNTLDTTIQPLDDGTTFVITGDIPAMWLRDSTAQVRPYMRFAAQDEGIRHLLRGVIRRQMQYLLLDAYANAFNQEANGHGHQTDHTQMSAWVWERKFELDSLCYPVQLLYDYVTQSGDTSVLDATAHQALRRIVEVMEIEQQHRERSAYRFQRTEDAHPVRDTLTEGGLGTPVRETGMVWSGFRPSDDSCHYGYLIPANMFAIVVLGFIEQYAQMPFADQDLATRARTLREQVEAGIQAHGMVDHPQFGRIYAYEADGFGNHHLMDDANIPSLLSIPYLGYRPASDPIYQNTRAFVLSHANPYFVEGAAAQGVGSPHTPEGYLWPLALIMQALTTEDRAEQARLLDMLVQTTAGTNFMHESFHPDDPTQFTRSWFAWANSLFGELVIRWVEAQHP
jgi:hypothetical protein